MKTAKYITFVNEFGGDDIIVFSKAQKHSHIACVMNITAEDILGAGFIEFASVGLPYGRHGVAAQCYNESVSLDVESRHSEDSQIANKVLDLHC